MEITKINDSSYKVNVTRSIAEIKAKIESLTADLLRHEQNLLAAQNGAAAVQAELDTFNAELAACVKAGMKDAVTAAAAIAEKAVV